MRDVGSEDTDLAVGDLALMMLGQHKTTQFRPEMTADPGRQRRGDGGAVHRDVSGACWRSAAVDEVGVADDEIVAHPQKFATPGCGGAR